MKKLLAISMALVLALALCACGGGSSSESKSNGFVGKWEMESYNSTVSQADDHTLEVKMEILDDKSFSYSESETDSQGHYLKTIVSGTYTESDNKGFTKGRPELRRYVHSAFRINILFIYAS